GLRRCQFRIEVDAGHFRRVHQSGPHLCLVHRHGRGWVHGLDRGVPVEQRRHTQSRIQGRPGFGPVRGRLHPLPAFGGQPQRGRHAGQQHL
ncbi:hypothetical protein ABTM18_19600, partial [Acinetobacter baumannii]